MKRDLEILMGQRDIDAILVTGSAQHNPAMVYMTGGGHLTRADFIQTRNGDALLFHTSMERDEASNTGLPTKNIDDYDFNSLLKEHNGDALKARVHLYQLMLAELGIQRGRLAIYGKIEIGSVYPVFTALQEAMPEITIVGELNNSVLSQAMSTKGPDEIERIRKMGQITRQVVGRVQEYLVTRTVKDNRLVEADGTTVTIGDVKKKINLWLAELGAENPESTIFAIGRDAGVPHSTGNASDELRLGETIVFDIFPCEAGGGYFYDFTRTWCLGYASDEALKLYNDVRVVFEKVKSELKTGERCSYYQELVCEMFEKQGHPTVRSVPQTSDGYVHSLGHGVGLNVHEYPWLTINRLPEERLVPGAVFTVEPGLYYPDRGMGVRLEDTVWIRPDGEIETLAEYPYDLVLPLG